MQVYKVLIVLRSWINWKSSPLKGTCCHLSLTIAARRHGLCLWRLAFCSSFSLSLPRRITHTHRNTHTHTKGLIALALLLRYVCLGKTWISERNWNQWSSFMTLSLSALFLRIKLNRFKWICVQKWLLREQAKSFQRIATQLRPQALRPPYPSNPAYIFQHWTPSSSGHSIPLVIWTSLVNSFI